MASPSIAIVFLLIVLVGSSSSHQLTMDFYAVSCPQVFSSVKSVVDFVIAQENRMAASLLRLHFHDCLVNGCDGSLLLDDTPLFTGEKTAGPNNNSVRGFEVVDLIKSEVERVCPTVVSCADILAIAARDSVVAVGGPSWAVKLGRRDSRSASIAASNSGVLPAPQLNLSDLISRFEAVGLSATDMVALSGAHTIGKARCATFRGRVYNDVNIDNSFAREKQLTCPSLTGSGDNNHEPLDIQTPAVFDISYYSNIVKQKGLLHSDQELYNGGITDSIVESYIENPKRFESDFIVGMIKMGDISPLTGSNGEIRSNCRRVNSGTGRNYYVGAKVKVLVLFSLVLLFGLS